MDGEGVIALLPMKGHSERVPRKNLRLFAGRPLYRHCLTTLLSVPAVRAVVIDTDCDAIRADVGAAFAAELASGRVRLLSRPPGLCGGLVPMTEVLKHDVALLRELQGAAAPPAATQLCACEPAATRLEAFSATRFAPSLALLLPPPPQ